MGELGIGREGKGREDEGPCPVPLGCLQTWMMILVPILAQTNKLTNRHTEKKDWAFVAWVSVDCNAAINMGSVGQ